jgi:hypothetical protein
MGDGSSLMTHSAGSVTTQSMAFFVVAYRFVSRKEPCKCF